MIESVSYVLPLASGRYTLSRSLRTHVSANDQLLSLREVAIGARSELFSGGDVEQHLGWMALGILSGGDAELLKAVRETNGVPGILSR